MRTKRVIATMSAFAAAALLSSCSGGTGGTDTTPSGEQQQSSALAGFDACTVLSPEELQSFGVDPSDKEDLDQGVGDVGCTYMGDPFILGLSKAEGDDLASWGNKKDNFDKLDSNTVAGRQGLVGITKGSTGKGVCRQILEAGSGSVTVQVTYTDPETGKTSDPCADATRVAEAVAPKIPK